MEAQLSLDYDTRLLLSWFCAALLAFGLRFAGRKPGHVSIGLGLMTVPLWMTGWGFVNSIARLADPGSQLAAYSTLLLSSLWTRGMLIDLGYVGAGFLLIASGGTWAGLFSSSARSLAGTAARMGVPMGGRSEGRSIAFGLLVFPMFLGATWLVNWLVYSQPALVNGDESSVWDNMTPYHTVLISLSAGFGEELLYRGVLMVGLLHLFRRWPAFGAAPFAVGLQALVFGFAHAGYGTWAHVIVPTLFGLVAGFVALRYGIWAAIVLHVLVDVYAFGAYAAQNVPSFATVLGVMLLLNTAGTIWWLLWKLVRSRGAPLIHLFS